MPIDCRLFQLTGVRLDNTVNDFIMLANTQFVENVSSLCCRVADRSCLQVHQQLNTNQEFFLAIGRMYLF